MKVEEWHTITEPPYKNDRGIRFTYKIEDGKIYIDHFETFLEESKNE